MKRKRNILGLYILKNKKPVLCEDLLAWAKWFEEQKRKVADTKIGKVEVSTVFLGIDHGFFSNRIILFETMVFGGKHNHFCRRYSTWIEAEQGHQDAVDMVKKAEKKKAYMEN